MPKEKSFPYFTDTRYKERIAVRPETLKLCTYFTK